ncbi:MAG: polysaccharide biosynthesis protein, partial [Ruminococcus sp.]|nr:polysaccharide biosynthesis protein [Ruminococcus sp.]
MNKNISHAKRTMIIGAGNAGQMLISEIINAQQSPYTGDKLAAQYEPVCIIDNDPEKLDTDVMGVKVVGTSSDILNIAKKYR